MVWKDSLETSMVFIHLAANRAFSATGVSKLKWTYTVYYRACVVNEGFLNENITVITCFGNPDIYFPITPVSKSISVEDDYFTSRHWFGNSDGKIISDSFVPCTQTRCWILVISLAVALTLDLRQLRLVLIFLKCLWVRLSFTALSAVSFPCNPTRLGIHMNVRNFPWSVSWLILICILVTRFILSERKSCFSICTAERERVS